MGSSLRSITIGTVDRIGTAGSMIVEAILFSDLDGEMNAGRASIILRAGIATHPGTLADHPWFETGAISGCISGATFMDGTSATERYVAWPDKT